MIKIEVKEGEKIERALKRYKRKHRDVKIMNQIRDHKYYTKKSVERRREIQKAAYLQQKKLDEEI